MQSSSQPRLRTARRIVRSSVVRARASKKCVLAKERPAQREAERKKERKAGQEKGGNPEEEEEQAVAAVARAARCRSAASLHKATAQGIKACALGVQLRAWWCYPPGWLFGLRGNLDFRAGGPNGPRNAKETA